MFSLKKLCCLFRLRSLNWFHISSLVLGYQIAIFQMNFSQYQHQSRVLPLYQCTIYSHQDQEQVKKLFKNSIMHEWDTWIRPTTMAIQQIAQYYFHGKKCNKVDLLWHLCEKIFCTKTYFKIAHFSLCFKQHNFLRKALFSYFRLLWESHTRIVLVKGDLVNFVYCFARLFHAPLVFPINAEISS